ncbi:unnamed protein product [Rotaria socialis]|uniref:Uncharacterized protein n=1 Tax=Rotaria socialis TaxID=392032 RepID=A0A817TC61_9BILA|nr:unnamed protein product [Rotaria socialis]CAF3342236.1 unnamed protein product [Rotaria socialis]CAF3348982.1 unnamed protein product [Rotaria socialis]CAF3350225.1 unnamed protein product [Rotaria socialis]CAF3710834.1 unnamed protein product [Rotaria socialis]
MLCSKTNQKPIIALDCDGVLLDYHATFAQIYEKAFGKQLTCVSPKSYYSSTAYDVTFTPEEQNRFNEVWDAEGWRTMPMLDGALQACNLLHEAGYELICVTAMPACFSDHRLENFLSHGFPINRVISTGYDKENPQNNPKKKIIEALHPVAFVDDLRRNFKDIQGVHTKFVFIDNEYHDDPNQYDNIYYDVKYPTLLAFVNDFLQAEHGQQINWAQRPALLLSST